MLDARRLGFEMRYDVEPTEFKMWVILKPISRRAKTAVDRALGDDCEFITAETTYDKARHELWAAGTSLRPSRTSRRSSPLPSTTRLHTP